MHRSDHLAMDLQFHEIANIFPMMDHDRFMELVEDVRKNGLVDAIDTYEGKILDGRNRYKACLIANVKPRVYAYDGDDPLGYVLSKNLHRRHMDESQRAMVGANIANLEVGRNWDSNSANLQNKTSVSVSQAAEAVNVGVRSVASAKKVKADGDESLQKAVVNGDLAVSTAEKFAKIVTDKDQQKRILETQGIAGVKDIVHSVKKTQPVSRPNESKELPKEKTVAEPTSGTSMQFAQMAILQLERIADWDTHKLEAVQLVENWIIEKKRIWNNAN
jgi:YesN/AraC family two-component response regulator